jgi:quinohemoprotein ethanol dehydrogenase
MLQAGLVHYSRNCAVCHGMLGISSGVLPDLRWSSYTASAEAWKGVVMDGNLAANGMVSFSDVITPEDSEAIRAYVITQAHMNETTAAPAEDATGGEEPALPDDAEPEMEAGEGE